MTLNFIKKLTLNFALCFNTILFAQNAGDLDTSFNTGTGFNDIVRTLALQTDGKILVGGSFTEYNGQIQNRITKLNTNGSIFNIQTNDFEQAGEYINVITMQPNGMFLVGGGFLMYTGASFNRNIARGSSNQSGFYGFGNPGFINGYISTIALQADGKILVGGNFTSYDGQARYSFARLLNNGALDMTIGDAVGYSNNTSSSINSIALQPDGKILVGGYFQEFNSKPRKCIVRLNTDGSTDTSFNPNYAWHIGFDNGRVNTIVVQPDGKIIVGGTFSSYNGQTQNGITRLNTDGSIDTSFNIGTGFNQGYVHTIALQSNGKILVGGSFTQYNGQVQNYIIRLNSNGNIDTSFNVGTGFNNPVYKIVLQQDGKILIGGHFTEYNGQAQSYISRLHGDSTAGTKNMQSIEVKIYPNPTQDFINISGNETIRKIVIADISGKTFFTKNYENTEIKIDVSHLPQATHLITIITDTGEETIKFIKN